MHSSPLQSALPPAKLSASADVKSLRSERVDAIDARIVMEKRGLLGAGEIADDRLETIEDRIEWPPQSRRSAKNST
jgi:hypothetical protein